MTTLPQWSSQFTPLKCTYHDWDKCRWQDWATSCRLYLVQMNPLLACLLNLLLLSCSQTATGSWLLSIVFDRRAATRDFWIRVIVKKNINYFFKSAVLFLLNHNSLFLFCFFLPKRVWFHARVRWDAVFAGIPCARGLREFKPSSRDGAGQPVGAGGAITVHNHRRWAIQHPKIKPNNLYITCSSPF